MDSVCRKSTLMTDKIAKTQYYLRILEVTTLILNQRCLSLTRLYRSYKLATENVTEIHVSLIGKDSER